MATKKYRIDDAYGDGYTEYDRTTGKKEHFIKYGGVLSEGYIGDRGSVRRLDKVSGNIYVKGQGKDEGEYFHKGLFGDDDYYGNKGTHITKHVYDEGFTINGKDGSRKSFHRFDGPFSREYYSDAGDSYKVSYSADRDANKKKSPSHKTEHLSAYDASGQPLRPKNQDLENNYYYYQSQLNRYNFIPGKCIWIYIIIIAYIILAQIFKYIPKFDILNHALLIGGMLMFAIVTGELGVNASDTIIAAICVWASNTIFHSLSFAYPRNPLFFREHFWLSGAKTATITLAIAVVVYILGRCHVWERLFRHFRKHKAPKK